jgi:hypothetical protein
MQTATTLVPILTEIWQTGKAFEKEVGHGRTYPDRHFAETEI